ncbi:MAG: hypothetical protein WCK11_03375 [Candidatus Falkowbacteria bacterium]
MKRLKGDFTRLGPGGMANSDKKPLCQVKPTTLRGTALLQKLHALTNAPKEKTICRRKKKKRKKK